MSSWIEQAQEELLEAGRTEPAPSHQDEAPAPAAPSRSASPRYESDRQSFDALSSVARLDTSLNWDASRSDALAAQEEAFRNLENRIKEIAGRLEPARPVSRAKPGQLEAAIADIRARQAALEEPAPTPAPAAQRAPIPAHAPVARAAEPRPEPKPEPAFTPAQAAVSPPTPALAPKPNLAAPKPAPAAPKPERASPAAIPPGLEGLRREIERVQGSMAALATRADLGSIERSIGALASEIARAREEGGSTAPAAADVEALQSEIQRLAGAGRGPLESIGKLSRDIDIVSHKLDIVAASGIDPAAINTLSHEVAEIRGLLGGMAMPGDISAVNDQLSDLKFELARMSSRQVDVQDFTSLRLAFEEMRDALSTGGAASGGNGLSTAAIHKATKDELQPIAAMLLMLIEKIERMERYSGDPEMLEQLERQVVGLSATIGNTAARDPGLADLGQAMGDLMREVAGWREGATEIAEQAARNAVAETIHAMGGGLPQALHGYQELRPSTHETPVYADEVPAEPERPFPRADTVPSRDEPNLVAEPVATQIPPAPVERAQPSAPSSPRGPDASDAALRRLNEAMLLGSTLPEADEPLPRAAEDEVLLEPGAERPRAEARVNQPESRTDQREITASFIAAARRAAQAAAADADRAKGGRPGNGTAAARAGNSADIRTRLGRFRRPLLVSAAALLAAIAGYQLLGGLNLDRPAQLAGTVPPTQATAPAEPPVIAAPPAPAPIAAPPEVPEPQTTQGIAAATPDRAAPSVAPQAPTQASPSPAAAPVSAPSSTEGGPSKQSSQLLAMPVPPPAPKGTATAEGTGNVLRQAALSGDPAALYELAVRTMEGRGVARDPRAAVGLFEQAGEKNLAPAQYRAGNAYEKGIGVPRDIEAARRWYQRAAENGNTRAMHNLAVLMAEGANGKPDYSGAMGWFQKAAEQGVRDSQFNLAVLYARGLGGSQDLARSFTWFAIAAGQGDEEAVRKRDEVGAKLPPADLARAKVAVERWRVTAPNAAANEVPAPALGQSSDTQQKRSGRA